MIKAMHANQRKRATYETVEKEALKLSLMYHPETITVKIWGCALYFYSLCYKHVFTIQNIIRLNCVQSNLICSRVILCTSFHVIEIL